MFECLRVFYSVPDLETTEASEGTPEQTLHPLCLMGSTACDGVTGQFAK